MKRIQLRPIRGGYRYYLGIGKLGYGVDIGNVSSKLSNTEYKDTTDAILKVLSELAVLEVFIAATYNNHPLYLHGEGEAQPVTSVTVRKWQDKLFGMFIHWEPVSPNGTQIGWSRGKQVSKKQLCRLNSGFFIL